MLRRMVVNRWVHMVLLLGVMGLAVMGRVQDHDWAKSLRFIAFDTLNQFYPRISTDHVVMIDIDELSMAQAELGQWPWPRHIVARLVDRLHDMGARAIVFDMVFAEYDRTSPRAFLQTLPDAVRDETLESALSALDGHDEILADSFRRAGNVVAGFVWTADLQATRRPPHLSQPIFTAREAESLTRSVPRIGGVVTNIPELSRAAAGSGSFGVTPEIDGIIRRVPLLFTYDGVLYPSLALEGVRVAQGDKTQIRIRARRGDELGWFDAPYLMQIGAYEIPMDADGQFPVWFSPARPHDYVSAWRVLSGEVMESRVRDKIVLIGTSAEGLRDIRSTPLNLFIPGVELHMNVVEQIMSGRFLQRPALLSGVEIVFTVAMGLLIIALSPFIGAVVLAVLTLSLMGGIGFASWYMYLERGLLLDPVYPGLTILVLFTLAALLAYIRTEAERKHVRDAFSHYISPDLIRELTANPDRLKLGGEVRELSVMFTDIRGFTGISEKLSPEELIQLMNDFLTPMSALVMENRGTIDKYMGDAMMAFWNAPLDDPDHARHACLCALRMGRALAPVNDGLAARGADIRLAAGIGINSGAASVGNMGSRQRFAYSALGDAVNLASRLEGQTKAYGVSILIGEDTARQVADMAVLELDLLRVKGKEKPVRIYTVLSETQDESFHALTPHHTAMLNAYRNRDFDAALRALENCAAVGGEVMRGYYAIFSERIKTMQKHRPDDGWDGVFIAMEK